MGRTIANRLQVYRHLSRGLTLSAAVIAAGALACQSTPEAPQPQAPSPNEFKEAPVPPPPPQTRASLDAVYFDFDRSNVRPNMKAKLRDDAAIIGQNANWGTVTLEGHCDERGSEEYNLALGDRRAMSVKRYLVDLGVQSARLSTVSFGEAKPAVMGHNESAWKYNRRVDFSIGN